MIPLWCTAEHSQAAPAPGGVDSPQAGPCTSPTSFSPTSALSSQLCPIPSWGTAKFRTTDFEGHTVPFSLDRQLGAQQLKTDSLGLPWSSAQSPWRNKMHRESNSGQRYGQHGYPVFTMCAPVAQFYGGKN